MRYILAFTVLLVLSIQTPVYSQLPDGTIAPNWTLTDINGNTHTLYNLLNQGKMVVIEFSATWCGPCWNYMLTGALESFWNAHGPNGANDAQVFYIEADWNTGMADLLGQTSSSQGNWVANIPFPIIDLAPGNNLASQYGISYYPTLYAVCHDHSLYELGQVPASVWADFIQSCNMEAVQGNIQSALCAGQGSATVNASGGHMPYTYHWSNGANTQTITGLSSGDYHVTVTEATGKISKVDFFVPGATTPVSISGVSLDPALCFGASNGNVFIDVQGGTPGYQYHWSNGSSSQDLHNVPANNYTLTITDNNGCNLTQSFTVAQPALLEADTEITPENCDQSDGTITLDIQGGVGNYLVTSSEGDVYGNQILNIPAGNVSIEIEDNNGCVWSEAVVVGFQEAPDVDIVQGPNLSCIQTSTYVTGFPSGGYGDYEFHWTTTNGHIISNPSSASITVDDPGSYNLQVTDIFSGCITNTSEVVESNIVLPVVDAGQGMEVSCENLQVTAEGSGDPINIITWVTSTGHIVSGGNTYHPIVDAPGIYHIQVLNPATNCSNQDSMVVSNGLNPATAGFQYLTSSLTIIGTDISTGSNLSGWNWSFGDGSTSTDPNVVHTYTSPGTYDVCLSVQNGCGANQSCQSVEVLFTGSVILVDAAVTDVLCNGQSNGSIILTVNGGSGVYTYSWTGPDTTYSTPSLQDIPAGNYQLVLTDDQGNIFINAYNVDQPSGIVLGGSTVIDNRCYGESNGSISLDVTGGMPPYLYSWNGSAPQPENFIQQLPGGTFQAAVIDSNGCVLLAGPYTIQEPTDLSIGTYIVDVRCHGEANGFATVLVGGGVSPYSYSWSLNGGTDPILALVPAGEYTCWVMDHNGCNKEVMCVVPEPNILEVTNLQTVNASNPEQNNGSISLEITGGKAPYSIVWNNGATGNSISGLVPGSYTYVVTDANGCLLNASEPIIINLSTGITEASWPDNVTITPNPTKGDAIIEWSELPYSNASLSIMSVDGKLIASQKMTSVTGKWELSSVGLTEGLYIILLKQDNQVYPFKLIVL